MIAKELKAALATVSDDAEVHIRIEPTGNEVKATEVTNVIKPGRTNLFIVNGVFTSSYSSTRPTKTGLYLYKSGVGDVGDWNDSDPFFVLLSDFHGAGLEVSFFGSDVSGKLDEAHGEFAWPLYGSREAK